MVPPVVAERRSRRLNPAPLGFSPFSDFSVSPELLEEFEALLWMDRRRNLLRRFTHFSDQDPNQTVKRMGFVPLIVQHGFAVLSLSKNRGPSVVCSVGFYYTHGVPDVILADSRWRVELGLGRALESAGRDLERRAYRYRGLSPARKVSKAVRRALQRGGEPLRGLGRPSEADLERHPYGFGDYFYRHYMDRLDTPLLLGHTGPATVPLPTAL